jgi:dihydrofolate reductase
MSAPNTTTGKVVVSRSMSLDGYIAAPGGRMTWGPSRITDFVDPADVRAIAAQTGAMLCGRVTGDVGDSMEEQDPGSVDYPFSGAFFLLTHRPPDPPEPGVTVLSGDIEKAVATARAAAGDKNLEVLGADVAGQCLRAGLVDEIIVYVLPVLLGDGVRFTPAGQAPIELEPISSARSGAATILRYRVLR